MGSKGVILAHKIYWIISDFLNPHTCVKCTQAFLDQSTHTGTDAHKAEMMVFLDF